MDASKQLFTVECIVPISLCLSVFVSYEVNP